MRRRQGMAIVWDRTVLKHYILYQFRLPRET
jgi:hypothetical protein